MNKLIFGKETYIIRGAAFEVYKSIGCGFLESVYHECLKKEFAAKGIEFEHQPEIKLYYKGEQLDQVYRPDFICNEKVILEIKACKDICDEHRAQLHNYLRANRNKTWFADKFWAFSLKYKLNVLFTNLFNALSIAIIQLLVFLTRF